MKNLRNNIFIIGFGARVINDIIPVLNSFGIKDEIYIFNNSPLIYNINGILYDSIDILYFTEYFYKFKPKYIILSIPPKEHESINLLLDNIDLNEVILFIDTPILNKNLFKNNNSKFQIILEDYPPSLVGTFLEYLIKIKCKIIFFYKSFFKYHGYSLLRYISVKTNSKIKIFINTPFFSVIKIGYLFVVIIGKREYKKAKIFGLSKNKIVSDSKIKFSYKNNYLSFWIDNFNFYSPTKNISFIKLRNDIRFFDQIDEIKRIGLFNIFSIVIDHEIHQDSLLTTLKDAEEDYIKGNLF